MKRREFIKDVRAKTPAELEKMLQEMILELKQKTLDFERGKIKDTNYLIKLRKRIAVVKTILSEKRRQDA